MTSSLICQQPTDDYRIASRLLRSAVGVVAVLACGLLQAALPEPVANALRGANIPAGHVALWVAPAAGGAPNVQHNGSEAFNPASVMKLVTSSAALEVLGPSFTWTTEAYTQGELRNGVLTGNLVLRGGGDPALTWDRLGVFLRELRNRGLRDISGDLVVDRSLFAAPGSADFDDQPLRAYNAGADAFLVNFKTLSLRLTPGAAAQAVEVKSLVPMSLLVIDNMLTASTGGCGDWRSGFRSEITTQGETVRVRLTGTLPVSCGEKQLNLAVHDGLRLAGGVFRALWTELGGTLAGTVREGVAPIEQTPFAVWQSPTLAEVLRDMNKYSNNVMARHVFLSLGLKAASAQPRQQASPALSVQRVRDWLAWRRTEMPQLVLENGSGLSRRERVSAAGLGALLQSMWQSPRMPDLVASLPIAGEDGTAKRRFGGQAAAGRAYLKTGSLNDVMATAGFVQDAAGQWNAFVMMVNTPSAERAEAATIAAVNLVANSVAATRR